MIPKFSVIGENLYVYNSFEIKDLLKANGFKFDSQLRAWYIRYSNSEAFLKLLTKIKDRVNFANVLVDGLDSIIENVKKEIEEKKKEKEKELENFYIPVPNGLAYKGYQKEFVMFAKDRKHTILADEMGLGKTIQAIALLNLLQPNKVLIVSPAFLKYNWQAELNKWLAYENDIEVINSKNVNVIKEKERGIFIVNYEITDKLDRNVKYDFIVYDEAHFMKNIEAKRTYYSLSLQADRYLYMTGTPILNNGAEIVPILMKINNPEVFQEDIEAYTKLAKREYWAFANRYCYIEENRFGKKVGQVKKPEELKAYLSDLLIRRTKDQVLSELPDKIRMIVKLSSQYKDYVREEKELFIKIKEGLGKRVKEEEVSYNKEKSNTKLTLQEKIKEIKEELKNKMDDIGRLFMLRHLLGLEKVEITVNYVLDLIEQTKDKRIVVMTWHKDVAEYIAEYLQKEGVKTLLNTGDTDIERRQAFVEEFQKDDDEIKVFVGTIKASGVGITLTKAKNMVFAEISYVPADIVQAEDRIHRIGQKADATIHFLINEGSIDEEILKTVENKEIDISNVLENSEYKKKVVIT